MAAAHEASRRENTPVPQDERPDEAPQVEDRAPVAEPPSSPAPAAEEAPPAPRSPRPRPQPAAPEPAEDAPLTAPPDTTMYLTVPALGLHLAPVADDSSKEAMDRGVILVPGTGFPWSAPAEAGSNTYLAAHRIGYPGTGSDRVFYDLPALALGDEVILTDSNGEAYAYRVSEAAEVSPYDTWVANPIPGRNVVTLQTCIEDFGDPWSEGPD